MKKRILFPLVLILLLTSACGKTSENSAGPKEEPKTEQAENESGKSSGSLIEPCSLISREEAEQILGVTLDQLEQREEPRVGQKICIYKSEDDIFEISLTQQAFMPEGQTATPESIFHALVENFDDKIILDQIGDEAFIATPGIHILKDGYYIMIAVGNLNILENHDRLKAAAEIALAKLD